MISNGQSNGNSDGGQGVILPINGSDEHHRRADMVMVARAAKKRWNVPDKVYERIPAVMLEIVNKASVTVLGEDGEPLTIDNDRDRIAAAKVLIAIEGQIQADDHLEDKNSRIDSGKPTELVKELRVEFDQ